MRNVFMALCLMISLILQAQDEVIFFENFEGATKPTGWTQEKVLGFGGQVDGSIIDWLYKQAGGHDGHPDTSAQGNYNCMFQVESYNGESTRLITPPINIKNKIKPEICFYHVQDYWVGSSGSQDNDRLKVYYKKSLADDWVALENYIEAVEEWTLRTIQIPDEAKSETFYIAFEGTTGYGHGVCIDSLVVKETGVEPKKLAEIKVSQPITEFVPSNSTNNPILRVDLDLKGNTGDIALKEIKFNVLNDNNDFLSSNGISLYHTPDTFFVNKTLVTGKVDVVSGVATFSGVNKALDKAKNTFWFCYDIKDDALHEMHFSKLDASLAAQGVEVTDSVVQNIEYSPAGHREIYETVFKEDFETLTGWTLTGEFEIDVPQGIGGNLSEKGVGNPDPAFAYEGTKVLGTDLTGMGANLGNYEPDILNEGDYYYAVSPSFNCEFYNHIDLNFKRYLNIEINKDKARIDVSNDGGTTWNNVWTSYVAKDINWESFSSELTTYARRQPDVKIRFSLGVTDNTNNYSGWNVDNVFVTGNYIDNDVGVLELMEPKTGCDFSDATTVKIKVKNFAFKESNDTIPLSFSPDGGTTVFVDTIFATIPSGGEYIHSLKQKVDFSKPGLYPSVQTKTLAPGDEGADNDLLRSSLYVFPKYSIPYSEDFETNDGYWATEQVEGSSPLWQHGQPSKPVLKAAASGNNVWTTDLYLIYGENDSVFLNSPCFDLSTADHPIFECKLWYLTEDNKDGLNLQYSIDEGGTWKSIQDDDSFNSYWNWYHGNACEAFGSDFAWNGTGEGSNVWKTVKHLLPAECAGQASVKFRFLFKSNESITNDGVAIDDVKIYDDPMDLEVKSIDSPLASQCNLSTSEKLKVSIVNRGVEKIKTGEKIILGVDLGGVKQFQDTIELTSDLLKDVERQFTLTKGLDLSETGSYDLRVYSLVEPDPFFYRATRNDTTDLTAAVTKPDVDMPDTLYSVQVDTIKLNGYNGLIDLYEWDNDKDFSSMILGGAGENELALNVVNVNPLLHNEHESYYLRYTGNGCTEIDSVHVVRLIRDLKTIEMNLKDTCEFKTDESLTIKVINEGTDTLMAADQLRFKYNLVGDDVTDDTDEITAALGMKVLPKDTFEYTFTKKFDLSPITFAKTATLTARAVFNEFENDGDDTEVVTDDLNQWGLPSYDFLPNYTEKNAISTVLDAQANGSTFTNAGGAVPLDKWKYKWDDESTEQTRTVTESKTYSLTVYDQYNCPATDDAIEVKLNFDDVGVVDILNISSACEHTGIIFPQVRIKNLGTQTITNGTTLPIRYKLNDGTAIEESIVLGSDLVADAVLDHTFAQGVDMTAKGDYKFDVWTELATDFKPENNIFTETLSTYGYPELELGDHIYSRESSVILDAGAGRDTYSWKSGEETQTINVTVSGNYEVTVTENAICQTTDNVDVTFLYHDLSVAQILAPLTSCELSGEEKIKVKVASIGNDSINIGDKVPMFYSVDGAANKKADFVAAEKVEPGSEFIFEFPFTEDFSGKSSYDLNVSTDLEGDKNTSNDNFAQTVSIHGLPDINLGDDRINILGSETLDAGVHTSYKWYDNTALQAGEISQTFTITSFGEHTVKATVTNDKGCENSDEVDIVMHKPDFSLSKVVAPITACTHLDTETMTVEVTNTGTFSIRKGEVVFMGFEYEGVKTNESYTVQVSLAPGEKYTYTYTNKPDFSEAKDYSIKYYVTLASDLDRNNDTLAYSFKTHGLPTVDLGEDKVIRTGSIELDAGAGFVSYLWNDGSDGQTLTVTETGDYSVTVTDNNTCENTDEIKIVSLTPDLEAVSLTGPVNNCDLADETLVIKVKNVGTDTVMVGDKINLSFTIDGGAAVTEEYTFAAKLKPTNSIDVTLTNKANLSTDKAYVIVAEIGYGIDLVNSNNTATLNVENLASPNVDLGADVSVDGDSHTIDAGAGFDSYKWNDNSIEQTLTVTESGDYSVTVTNDIGCTDTDEVNVSFYDYVIQVSYLVAPQSGCSTSEDPEVKFMARNNGERTLTKGSTLNASYVMNSGAKVSEDFVMAADFSPSTNLELTFAKAAAGTIIGDNSLSVAVNPGNGEHSKDFNFTLQEGFSFKFDPDTMRVEKYPATVTAPQTGAGSVYYWNNSNVAGIQTYNAVKDGWIILEVRKTGGCSWKDSVYVTTQTSINDLKELDADVKIYPNPAESFVKVEVVSDSFDDFHMELINSTGQTIFREEYKHVSGFKDEIHLDAYTKGLYFVRIYNGSGLLVKKLILQ